MTFAKKKMLLSGLVFVVLFICFLIFSGKTNAAPSQAQLKEPVDKQIIPYYEVWIRWEDVSNEHHYVMSVRDITNSDSGPMLYNAEYVPQNRTYFIIPLNEAESKRNTCKDPSNGL